LKRSNIISPGREAVEWRPINAADGRKEWQIAMLHKSIVALAWSCLAFIVYATLSSIDARPVIAGDLFTVLERFGAYALLGLLFFAAYPRRIWFVGLMVLGSAVILEVLQNFVPDRDARLLDATEKLLGGTAGMVLAGILRSCFWRRPVSAISQPRRN
jgi:VanZ family protein